jgi:hypothetical protein
LVEGGDFVVMAAERWCGKKNFILDSGGYRATRGLVHRRLNCHDTHATPHAKKSVQLFSKIPMNAREERS